jgi:hypothetical protein
MPARKHLPVCFVLAALLTSGSAAPSERVHKRTISDASQVSGKTFDYVIAGGGLGGSVLASRLSEDSTKTGARGLLAMYTSFRKLMDPPFSVLLIEAGSDQESNVDVSSKV